MRKLKILFVAFLSVVLAIFPISLSVASTAPLSVPVATLPHIDIKDISRHIARVGGVPAVLLVVEKLFEGIDWVMDPENNRVIFTPEKPTSLCRVQHLDWTWLGNPNYVANQYCLAIRNPSNRHIFGEWEQYEHHKIARASCNEGYGGSAFVDCGNPTDEIFISYDQIAQEILNNALQGHEDSISFIQEAAKAAAAAEKQTPPASSPASPSTNPESPTTTPAQPVNPPSLDSSTAAPPQPIINNPTQPIIGKMTAQCEAEWEEAYRMCEDLIKKGANNGITGGYQNPKQCAKGLVSEACGGNAVK